MSDIYDAVAQKGKLAEKLKTRGSSAVASKRELNYPLLDVKDFTPPEGLIRKLAAQEGALSKELYERFEPKTRELLAKTYDTRQVTQETIIAVRDDLNRLIRTSTLSKMQAFKTIQPSRTTIELQSQVPEKAREQDPNSESLVRLNRHILADAFPEEIAREIEEQGQDDESNVCTEDQRRFVNLNDPADVLSGMDNYAKDIENRKVRTVDLIPRQSSLNVNDLKLHTRAGAFSAAASFLFGFGARVNYQRQREQLSQFVQQELYSAAFGKGSREFGWTFTPMPGTDRLLSGVRTTYAVVIVPQEARSIILESKGCYFPRSEYQPISFKDTSEPRWTDKIERAETVTGAKYLSCLSLGEAMTAIMISGSPG